jgi:serine phosphatase RsbU (regulator of sigma subunit)
LSVAEIRAWNSKVQRRKKTEIKRVLTEGLGRCQALSLGSLCADSTVLNGKSDIGVLRPGTRANEDALSQGRFISLRLRLLGLVMLVLLPWLALVLYTQADERRAAIAHVNSDEMRLIGIVTSNQAAQIEAARQLLTAIAHLPQLNGEEPMACRAFLAEMLAASPMYVNLGVAAPDGNLSCSAVPLQSAVNVSDRMYFRRAMETRRFAIGDYQIGRVTLLPSLNYAYPVLGDGGNVQAVVFAAQSLNWLTLALSKVDFPLGAVLMVIDRNGTVLAHLPDTGDLVGKTFPDAEVLAALSQQRDGGVFQAQDTYGERRLWAHAPLIAGADLHATIGVSEAVAFADVNRRLLRSLIALGLVTLAAISAAWLGGRFILRQVDALVAATQRLGAGDLGARAPVLGDRSELELLARAFNNMGATLEARDRALRIAEQKNRAAEVELAVTRAHMDVAREIQRSLLPESPLTVGGMRIAGRCIPADAVGGDYFGYFPRGHDGVDSFIGDVSGHGVGAALLMAEARITFLAERMVEPGAAQILTRLNDLLHDDLEQAGHFITACCATFDAQTRELKYANAGHPPALFLRANEPSCTTLDADGVLLGLNKQVRFAEVKLEMHTGDMVVFYTDGITEARNDAGDMFGRGRLADAVASHRAEAPETVIGGVLAALDRFAGATQRDDDLTIVVMKLEA